MKTVTAGKYSEPWVLGVSASHNGSACLLKGNKIIVAIQEERLTRVKRDRTFGAAPSLAVAYCLEYAGINMGDVDLVAVSVQGESTSPGQDPHLNPQYKSVPIKIVPHHLAHAASAFGASGFDSAAVLVVDGLGSPATDLCELEKESIVDHKENGWESISLYRFDGLQVTPLEKHTAQDGKWLLKTGSGMPRFRTLGGMYSAVAQQIFGNAMEAGKVMGLAPFGKPIFAVEDFFTIRNGIFEFSDKVPSLFKTNKRWPSSQKRYAGLAASVQGALEHALFYLSEHLYQKAGVDNLCLAGGVALNAIANEKIINASPFKQTFIVPAADDSGTALGAAYFGLWSLTGIYCPSLVDTDSFGKKYTSEQIEAAISGKPYIVSKRSTNFIDETIARICKGQIGGWFQGGAEFGPRALGNRSIICDPRMSEAKAKINDVIKERESFRPFAPAILENYIDDWFLLANQHKSSPFMLRIIDFKPDAIPLVPAVVHEPNTGRVQTVSESNGPFFKLIESFYKKTNIPILLNTSFNLKNEPIVESPEDAVWSFLGSELDFCVMDDFIIEKEKTFRNLLDLYPAVMPKKHLFVEDDSKNKTFSSERSTPWGTIAITVPAHFLLILSFIDGKKNGWQIWEAVKDNLPAEADQKWLINCLRTMRSRDIIQFTRNKT